MLRLMRGLLKQNKKARLLFFKKRVKSKGEKKAELV